MDDGRGDEPLPVGSRGAVVRSLLWNALRGLAVGVVSTGVTVLTGIAILHLMRPRPGSCDESDLACLPDVGPLIVVALSMAVVIVVVSPVVGWMLRAPRPLVFELPVLWALVLVWVSLGPGEWQRHGPFNDGFSIVFILMCSYCLAGLWAFRPRVPTKIVAVESR
jgi:hypothetical protein